MRTAPLRLAGDVDPERSCTPLAGAPPTDDTLQITPQGGAIRFRFRNAGTRPYRHPDPIEPTALVLRWTRQPDGAVTVSETRALLPLALAAEQETERTIPVALPPDPGRYLVTLAAANAPDMVLAQTRVNVVGMPAVAKPRASRPANAAMRSGIGVPGTIQSVRRAAATSSAQ